MAKRKQSKLELTHPNAASADLNDLADWLEVCEIDTVAMESTGYTGFRCMNFWNREG